MHEPLSKKMALIRLSTGNPTLKTLFQKALSTHEQNLLFDSLLPDSLKGKFKVSSLRNNTLHLLTHSAAFAKRLQFLQPDLISILKSYEIMQNLQNFEVKIRPLSYQYHPPSRPMPTISKANSELLKREAKNTKDVGLRAALIHLSSHATNEENE